MSRFITRVLLAISIIISVIVCIICLKSAIGGDITAWAAVAAALAVITSVVSSLNSQRVVELEEDRLLPQVIPTFDLKSRYGLVLFRVQNIGASSAYKIRLTWEKPLISKNKEAISFGKISDDCDIPVLAPGESISLTVDGHIGFFERETNRYSGQIEYETTSGRKIKQPFLLDADVFKGTPLHDKEELKTHYELQKIPDELSKMQRELKSIKSIIEDNYLKNTKV